jgi:hypothetical protein
MSRSPADETAQRVRTIRMAAATISQLLVDKSLPDEDWERAARLLVSCRQARCELERRGGRRPAAG